MPTKTRCCAAPAAYPSIQIVHSIRQGGLLDDVPYPNQQRRPGERMFIVNIGNYTYQVPYYRTENGYLLMTAYPSRKATRNYLR